MAKYRIPGIYYFPEEEEDEASPIPCIGFNLKPFEIPASYICGPNRRINEYEKEEFIARGRFGDIHKVKDKFDNETYALKELIPPESEKPENPEPMPLSILHQINNLKRLRHLNITNLKEVVVGPKIDCNYLLLDYCIYNLKEVMKKVEEVFFKPQHIKNIMLQLLSGLQYLHSKYILHRDLCPKNILFTEEGILKIADFSSSIAARDEEMVHNKGVRWYRAPEILFGSTKFTEASDVFSVGVIFAEMVLRRNLLHGSTDRRAARSLIDLLGTPSERDWPGFSELRFPRHHRVPQNKSNKIKYLFKNKSRKTVDYVNRFFIYNPAKRPSAMELMDDPYYLEVPRACTNRDVILPLILTKTVYKND